MRNFTFKYVFLLAWTFVFSHTISAQESNDFCENAIEIGELFGAGIGEVQYSEMMSNVGMTAEDWLADLLYMPGLNQSWWSDGGDWYDDGIPSVEKSAWYHFVGDGNVYQMRTFKCAGSEMDGNDTQLAIFSGDCSNLTYVVANVDLWTTQSGQNGWYYSYVNFKAEEGLDYYAIVDGYNGGEGTFCLSVLQLQPTTDQNTCTDALDFQDMMGQPGEVLQAGPFDNTEEGSQLQFDNQAPTYGVDCWLPFGGGEDHSIWYSFDGDGQSHAIEATSCSDEAFAYHWGWDLQAALYSRDSDFLYPEACNDDFQNDFNMWWPKIEFDTEIGTTYYLRLDSRAWFYDGTNTFYEWTGDGAFCLESTVIGQVGISELNALKASVYPNPSLGEVTVQWSGAESTAEAMLFDAHGRRLNYYSNVANGSDLPLNVTPGSYILAIKTTTGYSKQSIQVVR